MRTGGIQDQHRQATFAIRSLAHCTSAIHSAEGRSIPGRTALLSASLAGDVFLAHRALGARRNRWLEVLINVADAGAWSWFTGPEPVSARATIVATVVAGAMETGFRLGAGTEAVPVVTPPRPWRPAWSPSLRSATRRALWRRQKKGTDTSRATGGDRFWVDITRLVEVLGTVSIDVVPPLTAMTLVRQRRGHRTGLGAFSWVTLAAASCYFLARGRAKAQRDTTMTWEDRTDYLLADARVRSRVQSALMHNVARVDPKGMLAFLERAGSRRAGLVLDELTGEPGRVTATARERGLTLTATVDMRTIEPAEYRIRWIAEAQVRHIRNEIERIDSTISPEDASATSDDVVTVLTADTRRLVLEYRGSQIVATQPTPQLVIRLEPTIPGLLGSSFWTLSTALPAFGRAPVWAVCTATGMQWYAAWRLASREALERRGDRFTAVLVGASTLLLNVGIARAGSSGARADAARFPRGSRDPGGAGDRSAGAVVPCPATGATQALTLLVAASWDDLPHERWWLVALAATSWFIGSRSARGLGPRGMSTELAFLLMPALASATIGAKTRNEAQTLEAALRQRLSDTVENTAREEARMQVRHFADQLLCVVEELPGRHPGLDDTDVAEIVASYQAERDHILDLDPLEVIGF